MTSRLYEVSFYHHDDQQMDYPQRFICWADDEEDADEQCREQYPRCTTTHIGEVDDDE